MRLTSLAECKNSPSSDAVQPSASWTGEMPLARRRSSGDSVVGRARSSISHSRSTSPPSRRPSAKTMAGAAALLADHPQTARLLARRWLSPRRCHERTSAIFRQYRRRPVQRQRRGDEPAPREEARGSAVVGKEAACASAWSCGMSAAGRGGGGVEWLEWMIWPPDHEVTRTIGAVARAISASHDAGGGRASLKGNFYTRPSWSSHDRGSSPSLPRNDPRGPRLAPRASSGQRSRQGVSGVWNI